MPKEIYLVKVGMSMTEGSVSEWYIPDGGEVRKGELVYALETEKVNLDVDAEYDGTVKHLVEVGMMLEPGDVVGHIFEAGEKIPETPGDSRPAPAAVKSAVPVPHVSTSAPAAKAADGHIKSSPAARRLAKELGIDYTSLSGTGPGGRIVEADIIKARKAEPKASPLARRLAVEKGVDLTQVKGTGPGGRIVQADIDAAAQPGAGTRGPAVGEKIAVKGMRKTIASRMHHSLMESAQLTMDMEVSMEDAVKMRAGLIDEWEADGVRPTYTDFVVKAAARALTLHPMMNSRFMGDEILLLKEVHIGIAVALPEGLVVPVIRDADKLPLKDIARESSRLAVAARNGTLGLDDYTGGTFTLSALGMYGVDSFTPIINEPQSGIIGINRIYDGLEWVGDKPQKTRKMNLSLTWDHRALDGAPAAEYLVDVKKILEAPYRLLV